MAAGVLLVLEAGGKVTDMHGGPASLRGPHILSDNGLVHEEVLGVFADVFAGRYRMGLPRVEG